MARVKLLELPDYGHVTELIVRVTDLNYGNHLGNDALVGLLHEARARWLTTLGVSERDLGTGTGIIQTDLVVNYRAEAHGGDILRLYTHCIACSRAGFRLAQRVARGETTVALAETGFLAYDYAAGRRGRVPESFRQAVGAPEQSDD